MAKELAIVGQLVALIGVLILFRYGMPYRVEGKGAIFIVCEEIDHEEVKLERRYRILGYVGLALTVFGSALQMTAVVYA